MYSAGQVAPRRSQKRAWQSPRTFPLASLATLLAALFATHHAVAGSSNLQVSSLQIQAGATISVMISIEAAPNEAGAFGLELAYDLETLRYTDTFIVGELTQAFTLFDVNEAEPGFLIVAGVATDDPIASGASGVLVLLEFDVLVCPPESSPLTLLNLVDDFDTWTTQSGAVECGLPILMISDDVLRIPSTPGEASLSIQNAGEGELLWEAEVVAGMEWLSIAPTSGTGNGVVAVTYTLNATSSSRGARIEFRSTNPALDSVLVDVIQGGRPDPGNGGTPTTGCAANTPGRTTPKADCALLALTLLLCTTRSLRTPKT